MTFRLSPAALDAPHDVREFDLHDDGYADVTHEMYRGFREAGGLGRSDKHGGYWVALDYSTCRAVAHDPTTFSSSVVTIPGEPGALQAYPITLDPPEHSRYRKLLQGWFSSTKVSTLEPVVQAAARALLDPMLAAGHGDFAKDFAQPLAFLTIAELVGIPAADQQRARALADRFLHMDAGPDFFIETMTLWSQFAAHLIDLRRREPGENDILSYLLASDLDGEPLSDEVLTSIVFLLVFAGVDTSSKVMATTLRYLALHDDARSYLLEHPDELPAAVEEFIRVFAPSGSARHVQHDTTLAGHQLHKGDLIYIVYPSANFDATEFSDPDVIDVGRHPNRHLSFGLGIHRCLGMHLARTEIRVGLHELLTAIPHFSITTGQHPTYSMHGEVAGVVHLPITITPQTTP